MSDYDVGYGKPPRHTQFRKGTSGNQKGRPKGSKNTATIVEEELQRQVEVNENGRLVKMSVHRVMVRASIAKAAKGSLQHQKWVEEQLEIAQRATETTQSGPTVIRIDMSN